MQKRWSVVGGKPIEDPDGEYETFAQAYKVADLEIRLEKQAAATALAKEKKERDKEAADFFSDLSERIGKALVEQFEQSSEEKKERQLPITLRDRLRMAWSAFRCRPKQG